MKAEKVWFDNDNLYVQFSTGHIIANPLAWFEWLKKASQKERENFTFEPFGIWWNSLEEGLSYEGLFSYKNELLDLNKPTKIKTTEAETRLLNERRKTQRLQKKAA